jgi:hypothetical protein
VRTSTDGTNYDTTDYYQFDKHFEAGKTCQKTVNVEQGARFMKVLIENLAATCAVANVKIVAT